MDFADIKIPQGSFKISPGHNQISLLVAGGRKPQNTWLQNIKAENYVYYLKKSFNYNRDDREYIEYSSAYSSFSKYIFTTDYELYDSSNITFYKKVFTNGVENYVVTSYDGYSNEVVYTESGGVYTLYVVPNLFIKKKRR